jgi:hypothetical protein
MQRTLTPLTGLATLTRHSILYDFRVSVSNYGRYVMALRCPNAGIKFGTGTRTGTDTNFDIRPARKLKRILLIPWCPEGDLNPHSRFRPADFKSAASADFAIRA